MQNRPIMAVLAVVAGFYATGTTATETSDIATHKQSVSAALKDLGVSEFEALRCMAEMPDHVRIGSKLNKTQGAADKAAMLKCLQEKNPDLTEAELDQAVDFFR